MTAATVTFYNVSSLNGRAFFLGDYRRLMSGVVIGLGTVAAVCMLCTTVTVAAAWIINTALATNPYIHTHASIESGTIALVKYSPTLASTASVSRSARVLTARADALDMDFEANRGRTMASASVSPAPLKSEHSFERANNALSPPSYPLAVPHNQAKSEIAYAPNLTHVATRTSAAAPIIPLPSTRPLPKLTADWSSTTPLPRPRPSGVPHGQTKPEIAHAPNPTRIATLTPTAAAASPLPGTLPLSPKLSFKWSNTAALPRPRPSKQENARSPVGQAASQVAEARTPPPSTAEKPVIPQQAHSNSTALLSPDSRTAVYDIAAHTVYLPSGDRLEAHSGLGSMLDDPSYVNVKRRGPTPPNVYDLTLREQLFHGVQAIRLNPVEDDKMFGRDGMLAHSYMLGPNGQSNGCVSFRDYPKFLQAFLSGEVDRLIVVPDLGTEPSRTARARSGNVGQYAFNNR